MATGAGMTVRLIALCAALLALALGSASARPPT